MPQDLIDKVQAVWPARQWRDTTVVVAVSGGSDSVALLRALDIIARQTVGRGQLIAAHFNHRLRGAESDEDQEFVADLCHTLKIPLRTNGLPTAAPTACDSNDAKKTVIETHLQEFDPELSNSENKLRQIRYAFLRQVVLDCGGRYLATAHHADDQVETVLHRIIRGTGIQGLGGIPRVREFLPGVSLVRPLLNVWRNEISDFLGDVLQGARIDSTNTNPRFIRNHIRHCLLPLLERDFNPRCKDALLRLSTIAQDAGTVIQKHVEQLITTSTRQISEQEVHVDCQALVSVEPYLVRELLAEVWQEQGWPLREMTHEKWNQLVEMTGVSTRDKRIVLPGRIVAVRSASFLTLREEVPRRGAKPTEEGE